jgi:hypothetical protein
LTGIVKNLHVSVSERTLKAATKMYFGAPAKPMPEIMAGGIRQVVAQVPGILEAHLPQCFMEGDKDARQVLVVGVERHGEIARIAQDLMGKLQLLFAPGQFIDILPFESGAVPPGVRQAGCQIFKAEAPDKKSWWRIW